MANPREIKLRIKGVNETKKITKAMKLIAAVKLKKAREMHEITLPFFKQIQETMSEILQRVPTMEIPYFDKREKKEDRKKAYIVITSDSGLTGGYNINVIKYATKIIDKEQALQYAELLQEKGAKNVIVSMGGQGAVYIDENGYTYKMEALRNPNSKIINTVGAGDSMVAGFIAGYELFKNHDKAFRMGMAAGAATVNSEFLATKEEIYMNY